jgi:hypothetical protein
VTNRPPHPCVPPIWKIFGKSTLKATVDLTVPKWCLVIHGALWCEKGGRESIAFPAREWTDRNGTRKFEHH